MQWFLYGAAEQYANYLRAFARAGAELTASTECADAADCGGLLLPGGGDVHPRYYGQRPEGAKDIDERRDAVELALIADFAASGRPILGICRGLQVLNVFFGGTLRQDIGGHSQIGGRDRVHETHTDDALLRGLYGEHFLVNSAHHQTVGRLGRALRAVEWAEDGTVEALRHKTLPILALQWHPERTGLLPESSGVVDGGKLLRAWLAEEKK